MPHPFVLPVAWRNDGAVLIKYSSSTSNWPVPDEWMNGTIVNIYDVTSEGEALIEPVSVNMGSFFFSTGKNGRPYIVILGE